MNRQQIFDALEKLGVSIGPLRGRTDEYLRHRLSIELDADSDPDFEALARRFDEAQVLLEAYHRADPWLHGEAAAMQAAREHVAERSDYDPSGGVAAESRAAAEARSGLTSSERAAVRAQSERKGIYAFISEEEFRNMSGAQQAAIEAAVAGAEAHVERVKNGGTQ